MDRDLLFVYGTLRRDAKHPMHSLLARHGRRMGEATFRGRLYLVDDYPGAVASTGNSDVVCGEVYQIDTADFVLTRLDDYEECGPRFTTPTEFVRRRIRATLRRDGEDVDAWAYLYNRETNVLSRVPKGDYLRHMPDA